ncbi:MAG: hypothetical protein ACTIIH_01895 [Brevibacterium sp.]|uniref:hypothetical protein n=1 Tax=Brevibacterium sp. TaxID=1701 RepID=UPI003F9132B4
MASTAAPAGRRPVPANQIQRPSIDRGIGSSASVKRLRPRLASSAEQATKWTPFLVHHDARGVDCDLCPLQPDFFEISVRTGDPGNAAGRDLLIGNGVGTTARSNGTDKDPALTDDESLTREIEKDQTEHHREDDARSNRQQRHLPRVDECQSCEEHPPEDEPRHGLRTGPVGDHLDDLTELFTMATGFPHLSTQQNPTSGSEVMFNPVLPCCLLGKPAILYTHFGL